MKIKVSAFGKVNGENVSAYTLKNANGMSVILLNYGGIIKEINVENAQGKVISCVQTFDTLQEYIDDSSYRGAIVGRYANRIGQGTFTLNGVQHKLDKNGGEHNLHGGLAGFHKKVWQANTQESEESASVIFTLTSPDGEGGFPGNVKVTACYTLNNDNELLLKLSATTDKETPLSFTQHAYFTLSEDTKVGTTQLHIDAERVTDADGTLLPTGQFVDVRDTPFDFLTSTPIAQRANQQATHRLFDMVGGYDHNYVLRATNGEEPQATVKAPDTGIVMALYTTLPGLQFYTGSLKSEEQLGALCLEPQHFPDAPNKPEFPNCFVKPEDTFEAVIKYKFSLQ
ncbi:aldose 1-epimerase [Alteromonas sp. KUL156]|nr:aldose 1-epimerase [Alteromonas sp. KUL154]GFD99368.1 aldose 1-epimerase [Alteromonas sp. KUL156]